MDPISAGIMVGGTIIGGLMNRSSTKDTNEKNLQAVRETNAANSQENSLNRSFARREARMARAFDAAQVNLQYERSKESVADARAYDREQLLDDRTFNVEQVHDQRSFDVEQTLAAEARARSYVAEDREYNSPSATRARLQAAGINPATGIDGSVGVSGGGGFGPASSGVASSSAASSAVANATAARAGVATASSIPMIAPTFQASRFGDSITAASQNVAQAIIDGNARSEEIALRQTMMDMENERFSRVLNSANMTPIVGGPYQRSENAVSSAVVASPNVSGVPAGYAEQWFGDTRAVERADVTNLPSMGDVEMPSGRTITALNQDLELEGPAAWANSMWIAGNVFADPFIASAVRNRDAIADSVRIAPQRTVGASENPDRRFYNSFRDSSAPYREYGQSRQIGRGYSRLNNFLN